MNAVELTATEKILAACKHEIAAHGIRGLRVQRVAKQAGVSLGLVYYHFTDRNGLLRAVLNSVNAAAQSLAATRLAQHHEEHENRDGIIELLCAEIDDDPEIKRNSIVWNEVRAMAVFDPEIQELITASTRAWETDLEAALAQSIPNVLQRESCAAQLAVCVEGVSGRWLSGQLSTEAAHALLGRMSAQILAAAQSATP